MSRLLQIEDDEDYQKIVTDRLKGHFIVEHAATMAEGLSKIASNKYDAILLDPGLPDSQREAAFQRIKGSNPNSAIVILTGYEDEAFARKQIQDCASGVLIKGKSDLESLSFASQIMRAICTYRVCRALDAASEITI